jgi:hypothetical protein
VYTLEQLAISPSLEHTSACQMAEVNLAFNPMIKPEPDSVAIQCLYFDCFLHPSSLWT